MSKNKKTDICVYVCTHKKFEYCLPKNYSVIQVGSKNKNDLGYIKDSIGKNISDKNQNFCELTGLYWIWKNTNHDITGLVHYRRYFYSSGIKAYKHKIIESDKISTILSDYDIILPKKKYYKCTIKEVYARDHHIKDYNNLREIIAHDYSEYLAAFDMVSNFHGVYLFNMFICKKHIIDDYCNWLFDILFKLEKKSDISDYDDYNKRIYGFLSERLFNVWIYKKKLKIKELPVYNTESFSFFKNVVKNNVSQSIKKQFYKN